MIVIGPLSMLSKHEVDQRLHGLSPFLSPLSIFSFSLVFFLSDFATASSLASTQYLIQTNYVAILI